MSASRREEEGKNLMEAAEKKLASKSSMFRSMFGSSTNGPEEAAELFGKAANQFKLAKNWSLAGSAFTRAAESYEKLGSDYSYEAASKYVDAGKMYKTGETIPKAISAFEEAVRVYTDGARFQQSARYMKEIAELQESSGNHTEARKAYSEAADFYDGEDSKSNANSMRLKIAMIAGAQGDYKISADLFEKIAQSALESNLLKYGARDHLLRAGMCHCVEDQVEASRAVERYREMDPSFVGSREDELLSKIVSAIQDCDVEAFTNAVYDFDSISKLDDWKTSILLKIKNSIRDEEDDLT